MPRNQDGYRAIERDAFLGQRNTFVEAFIHQLVFSTGDSLNDKPFLSVQNDHDGDPFAECERAFEERRLRVHLAENAAMRGGKMNTASNRLEVILSDGKAIRIQVMHMENPVGSKENPNDFAEDYCVISEEGGARPFLFRVAAHMPLTIEQIHADNPEGQSHWHRVEAFLDQRE